MTRAQESIRGGYAAARATYTTRSRSPSRSIAHVLAGRRPDCLGLSGIVGRTRQRQERRGACLPAASKGRAQRGRGKKLRGKTNQLSHFSHPPRLWLRDGARQLDTALLLGSERERDTLLIIGRFVDEEGMHLGSERIDGGGTGGPVGHLTKGERLERVCLEDRVAAPERQEVVALERRVDHGCQASVGVPWVVDGLAGRAEDRQEQLPPRTAAGHRRVVRVHVVQRLVHKPEGLRI
eukprot:scaffold3550_cov112-Isochrysis_galbana.AAC.16